MTLQLTSVNRALSILEYLAHHPESGVNAIADKLGLYRSTVSRQLAFLETLHYVLRNPATGKFRLGYALLALGRAVEDSLDLRAAALPIMTALRDRTSESVGLFVRSKSKRICIAQVQAADPVRRIFVAYEVEDLWPPGSAGRVLIAYMPPAEWEQLRVELEQTGVDLMHFEQEMRVVRARGYAISRGERLSHSGGISAPILDFRQHCQAVVTIGAPVPRFDDGRIPTLVQLVVDAAASLSRLFGYESPTAT